MRISSPPRAVARELPANAPQKSRANRCPDICRLDARREGLKALSSRATLRRFDASTLRCFANGAAEDVSTLRRFAKGGLKPPPFSREVSTFRRSDASMPHTEAKAKEKWGSRFWAIKLFSRAKDEQRTCPIVPKMNLWTTQQ